MHLNYHEQSICKYKESNMTWAWALMKSSDLNVGSEKRPIHWQWHLSPVQGCQIVLLFLGLLVYDIRAKPSVFILLVIFGLALPLVPHECKTSFTIVDVRYILDVRIGRRFHVDYIYNGFFAFFASFIFFLQYMDGP